MTSQPHLDSSSAKLNVLFDATFLLFRIKDAREYGIFRVEKAWLVQLIERARKGEITLSFLFRRAHDVLILDLSQSEYTLDLLQGKFYAKGVLAQLLKMLGRVNRAVKFDMSRRACLSICTSGKSAALDQALRDFFPAGGWYVSVGMTIPSVAFMREIQSTGLRTAVMLHDTIPLDMPQFCSDDGPELLMPSITYHAHHGDALLCNSQATADDFLRHARPLTSKVRARPLVAHLGLHEMRKTGDASSDLPAPLSADRPVFMILGTIEGRKNHAFLIDLWEEMGRRLPAEKMPQLVIAGRWGWKIETLRQKIDASPEVNRSIFIFEGPDDDTVEAILQQCNGLLMPSFAEGFGLPILEAAQKGIPVLANDLAVYRELAGDYTDLIALTDPEAWIRRITQYAAQKIRHTPPPIPTWDAHCTTILQGLRDFPADPSPISQA